MAAQSLPQAAGKVTVALVAGKVAAAPAARPRFRVSFAWARRIGRRVDRWFLGGSTPYGGHRREFPEVEFHQVLLGKRDRFDSRR